VLSFQFRKLPILIAGSGPGIESARNVPRPSATCMPHRGPCFARRCGPARSLLCYRRLQSGHRNGDLPIAPVSPTAVAAHDPLQPKRERPESSPVAESGPPPTCVQDAQLLSLDSPTCLLVTRWSARVDPHPSSGHGDNHLRSRTFDSQRIVREQSHPQLDCSRVHPPRARGAVQHVGPGAQSPELPRAATMRDRQAQRSAGQPGRAIRVSATRRALRRRGCH
jgi:hypothetical protein